MKKTNLIAKAKASLILDQPFFASLLLSMPITEDNSVSTMATDGVSIRYNSDWVESLSLAEVLFVLAHETLHCVFQHMCRRGSRNHNKYNIAADYVINDVLVNEKIGSMPKGCLLDSALVKRGKGTAEGVYDLLPKDCEDKKAGQKGGSLDDCNDAGSMQPNQAQGNGTTDAATMARIESDIRVKVVQAKNAAKMAGKLSSGIEKLVGDLVKTKSDWRAILRRFITEKSKTDYSFARPKRRFLAEDIYLPSMTGEKIGVIDIAIDCSGSIFNAPKVLEKFAVEIKAILQDISPELVRVIYFDSKVLKTDLITDQNEFNIKPIGGGGTKFSPIFKSINAQDIAPVACIIFTDLQCDDYGNAPDYPVLWASYDLDNGAPFGEIIKIGVE